MNNYGDSGIGGGIVLAAATALPATGIFTVTTNRIVILGVFATMFISFMVNMTMIVRYFVNSR